MPRAIGTLGTMRRLLPVGFGLAIGLASTVAAQGAASLTPYLKAVAGEWRGEASLRDGATGPATWHIRETGQFEVRSERGTATGTIHLKDGRVLFTLGEAGRTGTLTLHETADRTPWLHAQTDDGATTWRLWR